MQDKKGYIYIFTNPSLKDMVKIGYTTNVEKRRKELSTTALPTDYEIYATYEVYGDIEDKKLHKMIDQLNPDLRISKNREFFVMSPKEAYELLESIATISGTKDRLKLVVKETKERKEYEEKVRAKFFRFSMCEIKPGEMIAYVKDPSITAVVYDDTKVEFNEEVMSLNALAKQLLGKTGTVGGVAGPHFFTYKGKKLNVLRKEMENQ